MRCEGTARLEVSRAVATMRFDMVTLNLKRQSSFLEVESAARFAYEASYEGEIPRMELRV